MIKKIYFPTMCAVKAAHCENLELYPFVTLYGCLPLESAGKTKRFRQISAAVSSICGARWRTSPFRGIKANTGLGNESGRVRESGMPAEDYWETLLDPEETLNRLGFQPALHPTAIELGCGYGTFTIPVARRVNKLIAFDIDASMVGRTQCRIESQDIGNVIVSNRDVVKMGYGLAPEGCHAVLLFNILHCVNPVDMLRQAALQLKPGHGVLYATHWRHDPSTPRGPPLAIRPKPENLLEWAHATGMLRAKSGPIDCPPWHYGWVFERI